MSWRHMASCAAAALFIGSGLLQGIGEKAQGAIVTPSPAYQVDFNTGESDVADFTSFSHGLAPTTDTWTVSGGEWQHQFTSTGAGSYAGELVQTSGLVGTDFTISTDFTLASRQVSGNNYLLGLAVLSNGNFSPWDSSAHWILAQIRLSNDGSADKFSIAQDDGQWGSNLPGTAELTLNFTNGDSTTGIAAGIKYHLSVTGTYDGSGNLVLSTTLTDTTNAANTLTLTSDPIASPRSDAYFGYSDIGFWGDGATINYDNFRLATATPEPASAALLLVGMGAALLGFRRRRAAA